jgi:alkanesulfonate monooxygenase
VEQPFVKAKAHQIALENSTEGAERRHHQNGNNHPLEVDIFSTAPQSSEYETLRYAAHLAEVASWSEKAGCRGILIYSDNSLVDPWLVAHQILENTERLCPLVAVQPAYLHPYSAAKMVASLSYLYGRKIYLNMIAGGFRGDLLALCDETTHDDRYSRLYEYTTIIKGLLVNGEPFNFCGQFYRIRNLVMRPALPRELVPGLFISGTSEAGARAARLLDAVAVEYPEQGSKYEDTKRASKAGIRIGIIAAEDSEQAWARAYQRFPGDSVGRIKHVAAMRISDSQWHKNLAKLERETTESCRTYWLWPFRNYNTFCPYLVGSYCEVSEEIVTYLKAGFTNFILDIPREEIDLQRARRVFDLALEKSAQAMRGTAKPSSDGSGSGSTSTKQYDRIRPEHK